MWKAEDLGFQCMLLPSHIHLYNLHSHTLLLSSDLVVVSEVHVCGHLKEDRDRVSETYFSYISVQNKEESNLQKEAKVEK